MQTNVDTISVKLPVHLNRLLEKVSKRQDRSKSSLIRIAIQEYLEDLEDSRIAQEAHDRWVKDGKQTISLEEIMEKYKDELEDEF